MLEADVVGTTVLADVQGTSLAAEAPDVSCSAGILATSDGKILWERNADTQVTMASMTKTMTVLVALEQGNLDDEITVSEEAADLEGSTADLTAGDVLTLEELIYCAMLPSGNDAAMAIAQYYGDGDEQAFVALMNAKADELGMDSTEFSDSSGLSDEANYTTAYDYLILMQQAMSNDIVRQVVATTSFTYTSTATGSTVEISSTNILLDTYEGMNGLKTGYTESAGYCFAGSASRDGVELYAIAFGCSTVDERYTDVQTLLDWGFSHYHTVELMAASTYVGQAVAAAWLDVTFDVQTAESATALVFDYDPDLSVEVSMEDLSGAITVGDYVGTIAWVDQDGNEVASVELVAAEDVAKPGIIGHLQMLWSRFISLFTGNLPEAQQSVEVSDTYPLISAGLESAVEPQDQ